MKKDLIVYTDGASRSNPGPGGWAAIIFADGAVMEIAGSATKATNNQMELAAVEAVLSDSGALSWKGAVIIHSDSAYVINGLTKWVKGWEKNGWVTQAKTPVENKALWQRLAGFAKEYGTRLKFEKVKGHAGELYNERCDELAVAYALGRKARLFSGTQKAYEEFLKETGVTAKASGSKKQKAKSTAPAYSYVSCVNGIVHADKTWAACEKRVKGVKGAKFKKVFSKEEETALVQDYTLQSLL
jgi:ribonuclease HI